MEQGARDGLRVKVEQQVGSPSVQTVGRCSGQRGWTDRSLAEEAQMAQRVDCCGCRSEMTSQRLVRRRRD